MVVDATSQSFSYKKIRTGSDAIQVQIQPGVDTIVDTIVDTKNEEEIPWRSAIAVAVDYTYTGFPLTDLPSRYQST